MFLGEYFVIADVHLGVTRELYESGVSLPSQVRGFVQRLHQLKKLTKAKNLLILGDLKHKVSGTSWQEFREVPQLLEQLRFEKNSPYQRQSRRRYRKAALWRLEKEGSSQKDLSH